MEAKNLKQKTKKALYWKFAEQFSNYGVTFIVGIFMARLLSPSDYGITALPAVFMAIAAAFVEAGFTSALIRKPEINDDDLTTTFIYSTIVGIVCYVLLFVSSPWIADFYNTPVLKPLMRVTASERVTSTRPSISSTPANSGKSLRRSICFFWMTNSTSFGKRP